MATGESLTPNRGRFVKGDPRIVPRWKPGQSGNPSGVPKDKIAARLRAEARARERLEDLLDVAFASATCTTNMATPEERAVTLRAIAAGLREPDARVLLEAISLAIGKDAARLEHSGPGGGAIPVASAGFTREELLAMLAEARRRDAEAAEHAETPETNPAGH